MSDLATRVSPRRVLCHPAGVPTSAPGVPQAASQPAAPTQRGVQRAAPYRAPHTDRRAARSRT